MLRFLAELPVRIIAWLSDTLEKTLRFVGRVVGVWGYEDPDSAVGVMAWLRGGIRKGFWAFARLVSYPVAGFLYRGPQRRAFLLSIPFFTAFLGVLAVWLVVAFNNERILNRYLARVQNAYTKQNGKLGVRYATRWIGDPSYANADREFLYSLVQVQAGNPKFAEGILEHLSPEDSTGLGIAHFWRANQCALTLQSGSMGESQRGECLDRFRRHLKRASGVSPGQIAILEALDAYWDGRAADAEARYRAVWEQDPFQSVGFAELLTKLGKEQERMQVLKSGAERVSDRLRTDPSNRGIRYRLADVYEAMGEWGKAEVVYMEGYQINRDSVTSTAYREFLYRRAEAALKEPLQYRELAYCLVRLMRTQGSAQRTQQVLAKGFLRPGQELVQLQRELNQWLVEGLDLPLVHLSLALCKILTGEQASGDWHLEQAYRYEETSRGIAEPMLDYLLDASPSGSEYYERLQTWRDRSAAPPGSRVMLEPF